ncbi:tenascin-R isoform X3 [Scyliorhinus torazame]|uniref:tenascin-R isoform X3 n=1 Tax=Scyliorhinus torazame TaxID=75743 RepID=UPI003B5AA5C8
MLMMLLAVLAVCLSTLLDAGECRLLVSALRRKRDEASARSHNINHTVPVKQQSIVFNHVYNINVPLESLCSVTMESSSEQAESLKGEYTTENYQQNLDTQVAFTHNINIPKQISDCPHATLLENIISRLNILEREVSILRQQCSGNCLGESSASGRIDYAPMCNGHGNFSMETCDCSCEFGWTGKGCLVQCCPSNCSGHGQCVDGECLCDRGYTGQDCSELRCPRDCSGHGLCVDGQCVCEEPYKSEDCGQLKCPRECSGHGQCINDSCLCYETYTGEDCHQMRCLNDCSNKGLCNHGVCSCQDGYTGEDCGEVFPPQSLRVTGVTDHTIALEWESSVKITEYLITYISSIPDGLLSELRVPGNWTAASITGLEPGVEYNINVYAVLNNKLSAPINSQITTQQSPRLVVSDVRHLSTDLPTPHGLHFKSLSETAVVVQWEPLHVLIDGWEISFIAKSNEGGMVVQLPSTVTSFNQSGLRPGEDYTVNLVALKEKSRSSPATTTVSTQIDAPRNLHVVTPGDSRLELEWENSQADIDRYRVVYSTLAGRKYHELIVPKSTGPTSKVTMTDLLPGTEYGIGISAIKEAKQSVPATMNARTDLDRPLGLTLTASSNTSISLTWTEIRGPVDHYRVTHTTALGVSSEVKIPSGSHSVTFNNLEPHRKYNVSVVAERGWQQSYPSTIEGLTGPYSIEELTFSDINASSVNVSWQRPTPAADIFILHYNPQNNGDTMNVTVDGTETYTILSNLKPGEEYIVTLVAIQGTITSEPVLGTFTTALDPPKGIVFANIFDDSLTVMWRRPVADFDHYQMLYQPLSVQSGPVESVKIEPNQTEYILTDLQPATEYQVILNTVRGMKESQHVSNMIQTAMDKPLAVQVVNMTPTEAVLDWIAPQAIVENYVIVLTHNEVVADTVLADGATTRFQLQNLHPLTNYSVTVYAVRGSMTSASVFINFLTPLDPPRNLSVSDVSRRSALISWQPSQAEIENYVLLYEDSSGQRKELILDAEDTWIQLEGLSEMTTYSLRLQSAHGAMRSAAEDTSFTTVGRLYPYPWDCAQHLLNGDTISGIYTIYINGEPQQSLQAFCDMTTDGGGWTVFQRRQDGLTDFAQKWADYRVGFGNLEDEFWLGLDNIHKISAQGRYELRIDLRDGRESVYAAYDRFYLSDSRNLYKLRLGDYNGTAGDSLSYHQGRPFSTKDRDNDVAITNCASSYKGAWWYKNCHRANLNGKYGENRHSQGINWYHWKGHEISIPFVEMKMRPYEFKGAVGQRGRRSLLLQ